ncbi:hypothetical protein [Tindallia californiensis]|uniref:Glycogen recognition site of AMP-activated protein kinase n=1 Tax=Tindallia californiensis TaxID=159292 RepID=A0A1H3LCR8_9FIRM|nr:hypothetical protein [Tindallia californiensis]SDY61665.1 Glycogen recognition site of AMP-activated protein kinase [Tindallia californiensis]
MTTLLSYQNSEKIMVQEVDCLFYNDKSPEEKIPMKKKGNKWVLEKNLPSGEHRYAFLINGNLRLNDPEANMYAPDENQKIWSVILINEEGQRLYNNKEYRLHIDHYQLSSFISEQEMVTVKKNFNKRMDPKVAARFTFSDVTGLHCVTVAWYKPDGTLDRFAEQYLVEPETDNEKIKLWFWIDLKESKKQIPVGKWTLKLFIDGRYILEDSFVINEQTIYGPFHQ